MSASPLLPKSERVRFAKIAALLYSDKVGERDAAALAASRFLKQRGLTWRQVIEHPAVEKPIPQRGIWRQTVARCLEQPGSLRAWEVTFLRDLPGFRRLSTKQRYVLQTIAERVLGVQR